MKDVCEATNMSRGGLYSHFSGTDRLFEALLERISEKPYPDLQSQISKGMSAVTILENAFKTMEEEIGHPEDSLSIAIYEYAQTVDSDLMERLNRISFKRWSGLIKYGIDRGEFQKADVKEIVNMILYSYQGVRMWSGVVPIKPDVFKAITGNIKKQLTGEKK